MKALRQYIAEACEIGKLASNGKVALEAVRVRLSRIMSGIAAAAHVHASGNAKQFNANCKLAAAAIRESLDNDKEIALSIWKQAGYASPFSRARRIMLNHPDADNISLEWLQENFTRTPAAMLKECSEETSELDKLRASLARMIEKHGYDVVAETLENVASEQSNKPESFVDFVPEVSNVPAVI